MIETAKQKTMDDGKKAGAQTAPAPPVQKKEEPQIIEKTMVVVEKAMPHEKGIGRKLSKEYMPFTEDEKTPVVFLSYTKELMIFRTDIDMIKFVGRSFKTNDDEIINFIRNHLLFGKEVWENKYPTEIVAKMKEDRRYATLDPYEHDIEGAGDLG